jgi:hypothetical protein
MVSVIARLVPSASTSTDLRTSRRHSSLIVALTIATIAFDRRMVHDKSWNTAPRSAERKPWR